MKVPFFSLHQTHNEIQKKFLNKVSGLIKKSDFILGTAVSSFEKEYARYSETNYCVGVSNGLDALKVSLKALDIGKGHEIIVPANTFIATIFAILEVGAIPVLVEPDSETYNITIATIAPAITAQTRAIIPVHLYGQPCEMDNIEKLALKHSLYIIEDNAQGQGAMYNGKRTGSFGHINATSFYPSKNLGAIGDAGAVTTNIDTLAHKAQLLRNVGSDIKYIHDLIGYNARLDSIQALFLSCKLPYLNESNAEKRRIAERYIKNLSECTNLILPKTISKAEHVYHQFVIRHEQRNKLQKYLQKNQINTLIHYPIAAHLQPSLKNLGHKSGDFPITEKICNTCLSVPIFNGITTSQIDFVSEKIIAFEKKLN